MYSCQTTKSNNDTLQNERKTLIVIVLTTATMIAEIIVGRLTSSMALLADGYHMGSHAAALLITFMVYRLSRMEQIQKKFTFGQGKMLALGGFSSALLLGLVAAIMIYESIDRILHPVEIAYSDAIIVAIIGLIVNLVSAFILFSPAHHHHHTHTHQRDKDAAHHHDHNITSAYFHVLADALTSILAIGALIFGKWFGLSQLDPVIGIVGGIVILRWAYTLSKTSGYELLDGHARHVDLAPLTRQVENRNDKIVDLHVWKISSNSIACELIVQSDKPSALIDYQKLLLDDLHIDHSVIEVRPF